MKILAALAHRQARLGITIYVVAISLVSLSVWAAQASVFDWLPSHFLLFTAAGISALGGWWLTMSLGSLARWDQRLQRLSGSDSIELDVGQMVPATGNTAADFGWNRLMSVGRRWQALSELEKGLEARLSKASDRSGPPLLDSLSDGVATVDAQGNVTYANAALAAICGVDSAQSLIGQSLVQVLTTDNEAATLLQDAGPQSTLEWSINTPGGSRTLQGKFRPGRKSDGSSIAFVWMIRDVTQQRLADAMRDQFLATATHEFRTPLANIRAYAESLDMGDEMDAQSRKHFYNVIQSESMRLSQLVDDLLDISRMQAGALALDCHETDLGRMLEEVSAKVQGEIQAKHQEFRCELPPKFPPRINLDKGKLSAALVNLLGNATKYTPEGGRISFRVDASQHKLQFTVSDTGFGIATEDLPHLFERFYRSNDDRVRDLSGSGLGLALTREVARLHGGDVTVESQLNHGSTFCLTIPLENDVTD